MYEVVDDIYRYSKKYMHECGMVMQPDYVGHPDKRLVVGFLSFCPSLAQGNLKLRAAHLRIRHTAILYTMDTILWYDNDNKNEMTIIMITMTMK